MHGEEMDPHFLKLPGRITCGHFDSKVIDIDVSKGVQIWPALAGGAASPSLHDGIADA